ncbi:MAG: hypothetical protein AAGF11_22170 [Myxococcota bacterium]
MDDHDDGLRRRLGDPFGAQLLDDDEVTIVVSAHRTTGFLDSGFFFHDDLRT